MIRKADKSRLLQQRRGGPESAALEVRHTPKTL